jgi:hypothetical protein
MNHNTLTHIFTKGLHLFFIVRLGATLIGGWGIFSGASPVWANTTVSIIDTLEQATPATQFDVFGSGGQAVSTHEFTGPEFTLTQSTVLTEIGGFVNNCISINRWY